MFSLFSTRAGPALFITLGLLLTAVGGYGWIAADRESDRLISHEVERRFTLALINDYGSRAALRIGEDMTESERNGHRQRFRQQIASEKTFGAHAQRKSAKKLSVFQMLIGLVFLCLAGRGYAKVFKVFGGGLLGRQTKQ